MKTFVKENWFKITTIVLLFIMTSLIAFYLIIFLPKERRLKIEEQTYSQQLKNDDLSKKESLQQAEKCKLLADDYLKNNNKDDSATSISASNNIKEIHFNRNLNTCLAHIRLNTTAVIEKTFYHLESEFVVDLLTNKHLAQVNYDKGVVTYGNGSLTPADFEDQKQKLMSE